MAEHDLGTGESGATPRTSDSETLVCGFQLDTLVTVRQEVKTYAQSAGLADIRLYKFVVAVNEIMTNAVHHGGGSGQLRLWHDDQRMHCEVTDHGTGMARNLDADYRPKPGTIGGWGLWLAHEICERLTIDSDHTGTTVILHYLLNSPVV
jgi:serine/threonine-protein kinase RsbW